MTLRYVHWPRRRAANCTRVAALSFTTGLIIGLVVGMTLAAVITEQNQRRIAAIHALEIEDSDDDPVTVPYDDEAIDQDLTWEEVQEKYGMKEEL